MRANVDGRRERSRASRAMILDAAAETFGTVGFRAASLRSLAREIGMSHAGVLRHFASKEELLVAVLSQWEQREASTILGGLSEHTSPREAIRATGERSERTPSLIELYTVLLGEATDPSHPAREYLEGRFALLTEMMSRLFGERGPHLYASWDGLQLIWLYLRDRAAPSSVLDYRIGRWEESGALDATRSPDAWPTPTVVIDALTVRDTEARATADKEAQIVTAAGRAFARTGFRSTSLRDIAAELGTSHGSLLYYFSDKDALLKAVLADHDHALESPGAAPLSPLERLYDLYVRAVRGERRPDQTRLFSVLACEATDPGHPAHAYFRTWYRTAMDSLAADLRDLVASGDVDAGIDPEAEAFWLVAFLQGMQLHSFYSDAIDPASGLLQQLHEISTTPPPAARAPEDFERGAIVPPGGLTRLD